MMEKKLRFEKKMFPMICLEVNESKFEDANSETKINPNEYSKKDYFFFYRCVMIYGSTIALNQKKRFHSHQDLRP